jgi:hypothetical protein
VDPWLGSFRKSISLKADGSFEQNYRVPAYVYYSDLRSKAENTANKNMLTQQAMDIAQVGPDLNGPWETINATISTWNDSWTYRDELGNESGPSGEVPVWRKHKTFVWKDAVNWDGTYATNVDENNHFFNWGAGTPTDPRWQKVSEITRYNHYSLPLETMDINGNYVASRMSADNTKVLISGNARMTEMYYSGAERVLSGNRFEGEVLGANFRVVGFSHGSAHTGNAYVSNPNPGDKVFEIDYSAAEAQTLFREGMYKASFWVWIYTDYITDACALFFNGQRIQPYESVQAGCWQLLNFYFEYDHTMPFRVYATNTNYSDLKFDDFRVHPISSSVNTYVYNNATDDLLFMLDANNLATAFKYDNAGRLIKTYTEVPSDGDFVGGHKVVSKNKYKYSGAGASVDIYPDNINRYECLDIAPPEDPCDAPPDAVDTDGDGMPDICDDDIDNDGILNVDDNCIYTINNDQADTDNDGTGDACDDDSDNDGINDEEDNCPDVPNPAQTDTDGDGIGDACDPTPVGDADGDTIGDPNDNCVYMPNTDQSDIDGDGEGDVCDNCPDIANANQTDTDGDGVGDACDNCVQDYNPSQTDADLDGVGDDCDPANNCDPEDPGFVDIDQDGVGDTCDNCPEIFNPDQADSDNDGVGDICDPGCTEGTDSDGDGINDECDNCPEVQNPVQIDSDGDGLGDACDALCGEVDTDEDGFGDICDNCPETYNPDQTDSDGDGLGDACDEPCEGDDVDEDGVPDPCDNCPETYNPNQADSDGDGRGDACDEPCEGEDVDEDGVPDPCDNCPETYNPNQTDSDGDGLGDACDEETDCGEKDRDEDGIFDLCDNCPEVYNPKQTDSDRDGIGDACDEIETTCYEVCFDGTIRLTIIINGQQLPGYYYFAYSGSGLDDEQAFIQDVYNLFGETADVSVSGDTTCIRIYSSGTVFQSLQVIYGGYNQTFQFVPCEE